MEGTKQYVIPLFNGHTVGHKEWEVLWKDLVEPVKWKTQEHSLVLSLIYRQFQFLKVAKYLLIDGQQRLTKFYSTYIA